MAKQEHQTGYGDYIKGFIASLILTIIPFYFAATKSLPTTTTVAILLVCAVVQLVVHLVYFLHMDRSEQGLWNSMSFIFTAIIVLILIAGSIWIMVNLHVNMLL
ncbi:cytochrome o ubiquinol oxidase subunit IV [Photobacterium sp. CCB-ST2H9]|uniref:cytochrome o ubiquinol oxidase subunit IV n=1 Tax=unclassified Photobacterium TaxID=2628852 RepID=UPI0020040302|nr:cytochrome o ubiquinol oxidase subunit IV [Photobacterium sp. CCB-ST2H9]UTM58553.1 cytochrome o ubiquinol oxidase subunit IV [Photobacterium sp. CCB-ST2H9]